VKTIFVGLIFALATYNIGCLLYFNSMHTKRTRVLESVVRVKEQLINFSIKNYNRQVKINLHGEIEAKNELILSIETAKEFLRVNNNGKIVIKSFFKSHKMIDRIEALKKINIVDDFLVNEQKISNHKIEYRLKLLPNDYNLKNLNEISIELKQNL